MRVKICGITKPDQAIAIANMGATTLGFMCVPQSPRYLSVEQIRAIVEELQRHQLSVQTVGIFADAPLEEIYRVIGVTGLMGVQLHGQESPWFCRQIRQTLPTVEIIKAIRVQTVDVLDRLEGYQDWIDTLLLDAYHPQQLGGTGKTLPWHSLKHFQPTYPWFLAGGLNPDNILLALQELHPDGIDLSSGVEQSPGNKDLTKVQRLFDQLRSGYFKDHRSP